MHGFYKMEHYSPLEKLVVVLFAAVALYLAFVQTAWIDEEYTLNTTSGTFREVLTGAVHLEGQPPLYFLTLKVWRLFSSSEIWARMFSVLCTGSSVFLMFRIAADYLPDLKRVWLVLLYCSNPFTLWAAVEIRCYAMALLACTLLVHLFYKAFLAPCPSRNAVVWYVVVSVCAVFTQFYAAFLLLAQGMVLLVMKRRLFLKYALCMLVPAGLLSFVFGIIVSSFHAHTTSVPAGMPVHGAVSFIFSRLEAFLFSTDAYGWQGVSRIVFRIVLMGGLSLLSWKFARRIRWNDLVHRNWHLITVITLLCIYTLLFLVVSDKYVMKKHTYTLFLPLMITALSVLWRFFRKYAWTVMLLLFCLNVGGVMAADYLPRTRHLTLVNYIRNEAREGEPVFIYPCELGFDFIYHDQGKHEVVTLPRPLRLSDTFNDPAWVIRDTAQLDSVFRSHRRPGGNFWLICIKNDLKNYGISYRTDLVDAYVTDRCITVQTFQNEYVQVRKLKFRE